MTIERKVGMGIAGQPSGGATDVADVFSTYLYTGTGATRTITNGIDLAGEGGLVWIKGRNQVYSHQIFDTERGATQRLEADGIGGQVAKTNSLTSFNSNGFSLGSENDVNSGNPYDFASWTFRNSKKFFKAVTFSYGGSSASPTVVTHDLGCTVGMTFVKQTNGNQNWYVQHKDVTGTDNNGALNSTFGFNSPNGMSTSFTSITNTQATFGAAASFPAGTYVAYFFADNSSEDADDQMIKCGSYTGAGANLNINLGWEPQFVMIKCTSHTTNWVMFDTMRGLPVDGNAKDLRPNLSDSEGDNSAIGITSTGFLARNGVDGQINANGRSYIYMAIRAPMMKEPEAATDVFNTIAYTGGGVGPVSGFKTDFNITGQLSGSDKFYTSARITGTKTLKTTSASAEADQGGSLPWDRMDGVWNTGVNGYTLWFWQRAKGYMDVVAYSGTGSARTISHSLGVPPEMMWVKTRSDTDGWAVYNKTIGATKFLALNNADAAVANSSWWNDTEPTSASFSVGNSSATNASGRTYVAYLFATLAGISKVGSYSGNGTNNHVINCGFTNGARFVLIRRSPSAGDWFLFDSVRGITSTSNDGIIYLNNNNAQVTEAAGIGVDAIQPHSSGFQLTSENTLNHSELDYIFYAIA
mgnify:CR=1